MPHESPITIMLYPDSLAVVAAREPSPLAAPRYCGGMPTVPMKECPCSRLGCPCVLGADCLGPDLYRVTAPDLHADLPFTAVGATPAGGGPVLTLLQRAWVRVERRRAVRELAAEGVPPAEAERLVGKVGDGTFLKWLIEHGPDILALVAKILALFVKGSDPTSDAPPGANA